MRPHIIFSKGVYAEYDNANDEIRIHPAMKKYPLLFECTLKHELSHRANHVTPNRSNFRKFLEDIKLDLAQINDPVELILETEFFNGEQDKTPRFSGSWVLDQLYNMIFFFIDFYLRVNNQVKIRSIEMTETKTPRTETGTHLSHQDPPIMGVQESSEEVKTGE